MMSQDDKNTSVFVDGDFSRKERKAGGPTSVSATIDRSTWKRVRLGEVLNLSDGDWIESKDQSESGYRLIQTGNIGEGVFVSHQERARFISAETFARLKCTEVFSGDCLISRLPDPVGRACILPASRDRMITAVDCAIARPIDNMIDRRFFVYFTSTADYERQMKKALMGSTRQRISRKSLNEVLIPLPNIEIQRAIITSLSAVDKLNNTLQSLIAKYEAIKKATVNLLLEPKEGWLTSTMGESFDLSRGVVISKNEIERHPGIYPVYSSQSVNDGVLGLIDSYRYDGEYITWTTDGANAGTVFYRHGKFNCTNVCGIAKARIPKMSPAFVALMIAQYTKSYVSYVGNPKLMSNIFAQILFSYPSASEQRKIAEQISAIDNALADYKAQLEKARQLKAGMMSYFFG